MLQEGCPRASPSPKILSRRCGRGAPLAVLCTVLAKAMVRWWGGQTRASPCTERAFRSFFPWCAVGSRMICTKIVPMALLTQR